MSADGLRQGIRHQEVRVAARTKNAPEHGGTKRQFRVQGVRQDVPLLEINGVAQETGAQKGLRLLPMQRKVRHVGGKVRLASFRDALIVFVCFIQTNEIKKDALQR